MATHVPAQYLSYVQNAAKTLGIPEAVVAAQINMESGFQPGVVSSAGAEGIAQFEPGTFAEYGHGSPFNVPDAFAAYTNYMGTLLKSYHGDVRKALEAYNAGPGDLAAGAGYASSILSAAGTGDVTSSGSTGQTFIDRPAGSSSGGSSWLSGVGGWLSSLSGIGDTAGMIGTVFGPVSNVFQDFDHALAAAMHGILWIINPMSWVRIICGFIGAALVITGAVLVARSA